MSCLRQRQWGGGKYDYLIDKTQYASDQILTELAEHLGFSSTSAQSVLQPSFWEEGMLKVFLSHLATHREFAGRLKKSLREFGISLFVAHDDIEPTAQWETEILTALSSCDALIALLHPEFHASNWTDQEIGYAMGRGIPVFSVRLGQVPYGFIGRFQAFNGNGKSQKDLATELFEVYCRHKQTQEQMSAVLIGLFEQSNSFADAKTRMNYLENLETWQPSFSERIKAAIENNSQISHSFGVPERVKRLIAHWGTKLMDK